jgi:hypothetical protein
MWNQDIIDIGFFVKIRHLDNESYLFIVFIIIYIIRFKLTIIINFYYESVINEI